jgi:predicted dienelactone hydrolase
MIDRILAAAAVAVAVLACGGSTPPPRAANEPTAATAVGLRMLDAAVDPIRAVPLPAAAFYPATGAADAETDLGEYLLAAGRDLPAVAGRHPLVVISHGHGGTMWGHHDLATALARGGYVVAVVEHLGDSYRDYADAGSDRVLLGRAYQISAVIDAALADPVVGPLIDPARIGVAGFSAGGYTALLVVGARPDFTRMERYCAGAPASPELCQIELRRELTAPRPTADPRVRGAFVMAPFALVFGPDAFGDVTAPVFLTYATEDRVLAPAENALAIAPAIATRTATRAIEGAGHYVFLAPCRPALVQEIPMLCADPPGIDRAAVHRELAADAAGFFDAALRSPAPAGS